jgi:Zn-dependent membrane protease YugP
LSAHYQIIITILFVALGALCLHVIFNMKDAQGNYTNDLDWSDLVSEKGTDGKQHASWNSIGKGAGVFVCAYMPVRYVNSDHFDPTGGALLLAACLMYLAGVASYAIYMKAKQEAK